MRDGACAAQVHRGCLDRWRVTQEDRAFSQCTECGFLYEYVEREDEEGKGWLFDNGPLTPAVRRRLRFRMAVGRDFCAVFVVLQACAWTIGLLVRKLDCGKYNDCVGFDPLNDPWNITAKPGYRDDAEYCCPTGFIVNRIPPFTLMTEHTRTAYYLVGMILFFAIVGFCSMCNRCCDNICCDDSTDCCDWYARRAFGPPHSAARLTPLSGIPLAMCAAWITYMVMADHSGAYYWCARARSCSSLSVRWPLFLFSQLHRLP